ncbi:MAG: hypothetical protein R6V75_07700 [Bacteroidales bacterium]
MYINDLSFNEKDDNFIELTTLFQALSAKLGLTTPERFYTFENKDIKLRSNAMKINWWLIAKAFVEAVFGVGFVLFPVKLALLFGLNLDSGGALMAQLFGTMFIFGSILLLLGQRVLAVGQAGKVLVTAIVISNAIGFVITLMASLSGVWNALGWLPVGLFLVFGSGFAYFLFARKINKS